MPAGLRIRVPFSSLTEVVAGLGRIERQLRSDAGRVDAFALAYVEATAALGDRLDRGCFLDPAAVTTYLVTNANRYCQALQAYCRGQRHRVPRPWRLAFDSAASGSAPILQDLLLGINAHVGYDLPLTILESGLDPLSDRAYHDHTGVNDALRLATPRIRRHLATSCPPGLRFVSALGGPWIDRLVMAGLRYGRDQAWIQARALAAAPSPAEAARVRRLIRAGAERMARRILAATGSRGASCEHGTDDAGHGRACGPRWAEALPATDLYGDQGTPSRGESSTSRTRSPR